MQWDLGQIWNSGWQFYSATLILFAFGVVYEVWALSKISKQFKELGKRLQVLKDSKVNLTDRDKWFDEHLAERKVNSSDKKFRLHQYPQEIAVIPRSSLRFIPPILTAFGVLGTFWGMTVGLVGVKIDPNNVSESLNGAITLIDGMKTAFITSLLGLGTSTIFSGILAGTDKLRRKQCLKLRYELDEVAVLETPERVMGRLNFESTAEAAKQLSGLANQFNAEAIGASVGQAIADKFDAIVEQRLAPTFTDIAKSQLRLEQLTNNQNEVLSSLIGNMKTELIEPVTERLDRSAGLLDRSASVLEDASIAIQSLNKDLGEIALKLGNASAELEEFQKKTVVQLLQFSNSLKTTLTQFQTATRDVFLETATEIREGMKSVLEQAQNTFSEQNGILKQVGLEASALMNTAKDSLVETLKEIDHRLENISDSTQKQLESFRTQYQSNLQEFFDRQNNLLEETLGQQRDGLAGVVKELDQKFQEEYERRKELTNDITARIQEIRELTQFVHKAAASIEKLSSAVESSHLVRIKQLEEISHSVGDQVDRIELSNRELTNNYAQSMQSLEKMLQQMIDGEQNFFKAADSAMAKVSGNLLDVANVLVEVSKAK